MGNVIALRAPVRAVDSATGGPNDPWFAAACAACAFALTLLLTVSIGALVAR